MGIVMKVLNRQYHRDQYREQGFTLIELVITIAIIAIIAAMAAPSMQRQIQQAKARKAVSIIESALRDTQVQAIISQKNTKVVLTNTNNVKNFKSFYVGDNVATATPQAIYNLGADVLITPIPSTLLAVSFTPTKKSYQGQTVISTRMGQDANDAVATTGFYICVGSGNPQYLVEIDASNSIKSSKSGSCS